MRLNIVSTLLLLFFLNIAFATTNMQLQASTFAQLPGWQQGEQAKSLQAFQASCRNMPPQSRWATVCAKALQLQTPDNVQARQFFQTNFIPMHVSDDKQTTGLFTGYFTPVVDGSLTKQDLYNVPIYTRPNDLIEQKGKDGQLDYGMLKNRKFVPYYSRAQIDHGILNDKQLEVLWLKSPIDRFFLQIQGSGLVQLPDGKLVALIFDGKNGQPYTAIGDVLRDEQAIPADKISMQTIRDWLEAHPRQAVAVMQQNASYVFFKIQPVQKNIIGIRGSSGVALTPGYSLAVDQHYIPFGTPLWLVTTIPTEPANNNDPKDYRQLMIAQDTGSAIKGVIRGDIFWGNGTRAEYLAGHMNSQGQIWLLSPKS